MHLVLNSFGTALSKENDQFMVTSNSGKQAIFPNDVASISLSKGARITSDAILLAIEYQIDVFFVDGMGNPKGRVWSVQYGSISDIRRKQLEFLYGPAALEWVKALLNHKVNNQIGLLLALQGEITDDLRKRKITNAIRSMEDHRDKIRACEAPFLGDIAPSLRGWEGAASRRYFEALAQVLPIEYQFERRSQNPATDRFNALLNYGYGMLYGKVEGALIKAGIDPYAGIFHRDDYNRPALVYDVIERFRIWVDYVAIQLCQAEVFHDDCFTNEGHALLLDGLGKRILIQSVNDYLAEIIPYEGAERSRGEHINRYARKLAQLFLATETPTNEHHD